MIKESSEKLPGMIFLYPGQNSFPEKGVKQWSLNGSYPIDQTMARVRELLGPEFQSKWAKPVVLLGLTAAIAGGLIYYLKKRPSAHIGLSMGEMSGFVASESVEIDPMLQVMRTRSRLADQPTDPESGLAVIVGPSVEEVKSRIDQAKKDGLNISLANINTRTQTVLGGWVDDLIKSARYFRDAKIFKPIEGVKRAFHTPFMDDIVGPFGESVRSILSTVTLRSPRDQVYSPMQYAATRKALTESPEQVINVILGQLNTPIDQPPVWEEMLNNKDGPPRVIVCFDPKNITPGIAREYVGGNIPVLNVATPSGMRDALIALYKIYPSQLGQIQKAIDELDELINPSNSSGR